MKTEVAWPTQAILEWLQQILLERFGNVFTVHVAEAEVICLSLVDHPAIIAIASAPLTFTGSGSVLPFTTWNAAAEGWQSALGKPLPAPGAASFREPLIELTDSGYHVHYDILGLTYWMLSRQEEVGRFDLDNHGRFAASSSHAFRHGYLERPVVDEWLHILGQVIQRLWPELPLRRHQFSVKVSHDVDEPSRYGFRSIAAMARGMAGDLLKRGDLRSALLAPWVRLNSNTVLHPSDPANTFNWIMDLSESHGLISAFYFICGRTDARKDADYEPGHPAIRELMRRIHSRGHEIGLHPSYNTYRTPAAVAAEAARLRQICSEEGIAQAQWGGRMHYLRWEQPTTMRGLELAGLSYDTTLCYADRPGFRCGTCFEYPAFDPTRDQALNLRIRPLVAMENTVIASCYMGLGTRGNGALDKFSELKDACMAVDGCFTLLWHNSHLSSAAERRLFMEVLDA
jgi:hypothetical protein